jgi:hypothetical protein
MQARDCLPAPAGLDAAEARLESGELLFLGAAPFALPAADDQAFLLRQRPDDWHKHITCDPSTGDVTGCAPDLQDAAGHLAGILTCFSRAVRDWLDRALPRYAGCLTPDRATLRTVEEATRCLRRNARNDLLHVDAFPDRPARGRRILRVFANIHPTEERIWITTDSLVQLMPRLGQRVQKSSAGFFHCLGVRLLDPFRPEERRHLDSDVFMLRLHDYLKRKTEFQLRSPRRLWKFPPGSAWLAMTDACCHAELRGRAALEHSFFVAPEVLVRPELAPARLMPAA